MRLSRYCGRERLPGGRRLWERLARRAGFRGAVAVYGYGVGGRPGGAQRKAERTGIQDGMVIADYEPGLIRVWLPCTCQAADFDSDQLHEDHEDPLASFAHELGHHVQYARRRPISTRRSPSATGGCCCGSSARAEPAYDVWVKVTSADPSLERRVAT